MFLKSFQFKLFSSFILFGLILSAITLYIFTKVIEDGYLSQKTDLFYDEIVEKEKYIDTFQYDMKAKIEQLSKSDYFKGQLNYETLKQFLNTILNLNESLDGVVFLDNRLKERINISKNTSEIYPLDKLDSLKDGQVVITNFFYNKNANIPYFKIIKRIKKGYLIFDINLENTIFNIVDTTYKENWYITDEKGKFIIYEDKKHDKPDFTLKDEFPKNYKFILQEDIHFDNQLMSRKIKLENSQEIILVLSYTEDFTQELKEEYLFLFRIIVLASILASIFLGFILSKPFIRINRRLNKLNDSLDQQVKTRTQELSNSLELIDKYIITSKTDLHGNITSVSEAFCNVSGYKKDELIGKAHNIIKNENNSNEIFIQLWEKLKSGKIWSGEMINKSKDGKKYYVYSNIEPIFKDGKVVEYMAVSKDITDKKELENLNLELASRIKQEVALNIEQHKQHVEDRIKNAQLSSIGQLAAGITHEINTPLTLIKGNIEMMKYDVEDINDERLQKSFFGDFKKIDEGINRIENIIETMREVSQSNQESKHVVNIFETLIISLTMLNNRIKQTSKVYLNGELFTSDIKKDKFIFNAYVQKQRLEQLWIIILNNALDIVSNISDYEDRRIEIFIEKKDKEVLIKIVDNGGGIKEDIIDNIFDPLHSTKKHGGLGVGLNIAKKIVDEQEGKIKAYNENINAVFEVVLNEHR